MTKLWAALTRLKNENENENENEADWKLARVLNLFDLTTLGVGSTLGLGVYVLAGSVAYDMAGPAVTISFLIAAIASGFAGICYAEFAARVPKAGSAYVYSYVTIGEFVAFTIGWNLILEFILGTASGARGFSGYLDSLFNKRMSMSLEEVMPIRVDFLSSYPDFLSFGMVLILTALLAFGVKESSLLNNIFTAVNMATILVVIIAGAMKADPANWSIPADKVPDGFGVGGFMPYGIAGVMAGAAKCFYGFIGFDIIATTGEEAINPKRNIPLSIVLSLIIIFLSYFGVSTVLIMMVPYYDQDKDAPFPVAFENVGWITMKWIVTIGAVFALCTSTLGGMFPLPRVLYAMGNDGLLFKTLARVNSYTRTPLVATIIAGSCASIMALFLNLDQLINMMSIGTLLAYTIVAISVMVLRYQDDDMQKITFSTRNIFHQFYNGNSYKKPNVLTSRITKIGVVLFTIVSIIWCTCDKFYALNTNEGIITVTVIGVVMISILSVIAFQPTSSTELTFRVPLVPFIPCLSILINLYLMFQLDIFTWIRFSIWLIIGYIIYFTYGIRNSVQICRDHNDNERTLYMQQENASFEPDWIVKNDGDSKDTTSVRR